jgi:hypothetical protein
MSEMKNRLLGGVVSQTNAAGWVARIWSLVIFLFMLVRIFTPDPTIVAPVPLEDYFLLSLWGLAITALMLAWHWPRFGAWLTIGLMAFRELCWVILKGGWLLNFLLIWLVILPPALLYLSASSTSRRSRQAV